MTFCGGQRDALTTAGLKENTNATRARPQQRLVIPQPDRRLCWLQIAWQPAMPFPNFFVEFTFGVSPVPGAIEMTENVPELDAIVDLVRGAACFHLLDQFCEMITCVIKLVQKHRPLVRVVRVV
jgi:hypothetical protein